MSNIGSQTVLLCPERHNTDGYSLYPILFRSNIFEHEIQNIVPQVLSEYGDATWPDYLYIAPSQNHGKYKYSIQPVVDPFLVSRSRFPWAPPKDSDLYTESAGWWKQRRSRVRSSPRQALICFQERHWEVALHPPRRYLRTTEQYWERLQRHPRRCSRPGQCSRLGKQKIAIRREKKT